jgi:hypothetical protein
MITIGVAASSVMSALWFLHWLREHVLGEALTLENLRKAKNHPWIQEEITFLGPRNTFIGFLDLTPSV